MADVEEETTVPSEEKKEEKKASKPRMTCRERIEWTRKFFRGLGAVVGFLLLLQGIMIFIGEAVGHMEAPIDDFWKACHWAAEGVLTCLLGIFCMALELQTCFKRVGTSLGRYAANRLFLSFCYLWVGAWSMDGRIQAGGSGWQLLGKITAFTAWVVCIMHLLLACCARRAEQVHPSEADKDGADLEAGKTGDDTKPETKEKGEMVATRPPSEEKAVSEARAKERDLGADTGAGCDFDVETGSNNSPFAADVAAEEAFEAAVIADKESFSPFAEDVAAEAAKVLEQAQAAQAIAEEAEKKLVEEELASPTGQAAASSPSIVKA